MPKNAFQDIVAKSKKIPPKAEPAPLSMNEGKKIAAQKSEEVSKIFRKTNYPAFTASRPDNGGRYALWGLAAVSVFFLVFALSSLFSGATVTITPMTQAFSLDNASFAAELDNPDSDLLFQRMTLTDMETKTINSSKSEIVDKKASGQVIIYNNYSKQPQQLVINTRLEDPSGKIFRLDSAVTVPGISVQNGENIPGSVEVGVHADKTGEEYNIGLADFTIPGFKGSPRYSKFYARSKTEIGGAIKGEVFVADQAEIDQVSKDLTAALKDKLIKKANAELPLGFILLQDAAYFEVTNNNATFESKTKDVPITVEGKLLALIFDEEKLTNKIALLAIKDFDPKQPVYISKIGDLNFTLTTDISALATAEEITFYLSGDGKIIWAVDEDKLKTDLLAVAKSDLKDVLANYPNIVRAEAKISPVWRSKFPRETKDIKIINTEASK